MTEQITFTPRQIGRFNFKQYNVIREYYNTLCADLTMLYSQLSGLFDNFTVNDLFEFLQNSNPERWLMIKYAESKQNEFPELDVSAMIGTGILKMPFAYNESIADYEKINLIINQISDVRFFYPLRKLFHQTENESYFALTEEFRITTEKFITPKTQSISQNDALAALEGIQEGLNTLHNMKILNFQTHGINFLGLISEFFVLDKAAKDMPVDIDKHAFLKTKLRRFYIKNGSSENEKYKDKMMLFA